MNYFIGKDSDKWHTGLPTFECLRYTGVYPGTNLIYYGNKGNLEFDFQLSPGAAPSQIQMRFEGARSLRIDGKGDLIVTANNGHISFQKPVVYQPGEGGRKDLVAGYFKILKNDTVGFAVARYDRAKPLIIDPILNYSTYIGPTTGATAEGTAIAVDQNGEAYVTGSASLGFPTTPGSFQPIPPGQGGPFVAKFNSTGTALLYSTFLNGSGIDAANGITLDANGDAFVVGSTSSKDFPTTAGALQTENNASEAAGFVTELNSTGNSLLYSTYLGGSTLSFVNGVAIDASGNAYMTGGTHDTNFPTTPGAYRTTAITKATADPHSYSAFIAKLNPAGTALVYSTYLGGSQSDTASAIAVDSAGEAYVGGSTLSSDFPVTQGSFQGADHTTTGEYTGFVTKLNASGSALLYSTYLGGSASDGVNAIAVDSNGDAYATGSTTSPDFPVTAGAFQSNIGISYYGYPQVNAFVTELSSAGTSLVYSTFLGGGFSLGPDADEGDQATSIAVDGQGIVYLAGMACTGDYPVTAGAFEPQNRDGEIDGECTAFLTKMKPAPNTALLYSTFFGGTGDGDDFYGEKANGLAIDPSGNVYLAGYTVSVDFPVTAGVFETAFTGPSQEAFVAEFNGSEMKSLPIPKVTLTSSTSSVLFGQPVTFTATVQPASGNNTPTGYVGFNFFQLELSDAEGTELGFGPWTTVALNGSGAATFSTSSLEYPQTQVNAFYLGDANNAPAMATMTQTLTYIQTTTTVTASVNNVLFGTPVVFTATVLDNTGKPAKGGVYFGIGNIEYGGSDLDSNGQATWTDSSLPVGTTTIFANYDFVLGYAESSGTVNVTITPLGATPDPTLTPPAGTYYSAQQITLGDSNSAALVYFTTDGSTPVPGASAERPVGFTVPVDASETLSLVAVAPGYSPSNVVSAAYSILPPPGFTAGPGSTASMTVTRGSTTGNTGTISVVGTNGFSGTVNLTCSVTTTMPGGIFVPECTLSPVSVTLSGTAAQTSTLTIITIGASSAENRSRFLFWVSPGGTALALVLFFGGFRRRGRWAILWLFVLFVGAGMSACGGSSSGGGINPNLYTTLGSYTITVTGTSGGISSTVGTVALTVQ
ncbi:MAG: SBBP repeat-containing protein [Terracidiphilus sp.]